MNKRLTLLIMGLIFATQISYGQDLAIKTNILYGAASLTPNLGVEIGLSPKTTLELSAGYNPWNLNGDNNDNKKLVHILGHVEFRYWTCQRFSGHFFGVHALGSSFNIGQRKMDFLFGDGSDKIRHEGYAVGGGLSYGYQWLLGKRWSLEATIGLGAAYLDYSRYQCPKCGELIDKNDKMYFGPTKAGVKLVYIIK